MEATNMAGSAFCDKPFETHQFKGDGDTFECDTCKRPRAMHLHDGFTPVYQDLDVRIFKPFGRVRPRNKAMGFRSEKKKAIYRDAGTVIWSS